MMMYVSIAIVIFAGGILAWVWIYENFFKTYSATSKIVPSRKSEDTSFLKSVLNRGAIGEPLVMYAPVKKKQLEADPYRLKLPVYTVSCQERGFVVGVSGAGKTNFIFAQIADWMKSGKSFVVTDVKPEIFGVVLAQGAITVRMDNDLLDTFKAICEREGYSQTLIIRELVKKYVAKNGQGDLFK